MRRLRRERENSVLYSVESCILGLFNFLARQALFFLHKVWLGGLLWMDRLGCKVLSSVGEGI